MNDIIALVQYLSEPAARGSNVVREEAPHKCEDGGSVQCLSRRAARRAPARRSRRRFGAWMCRLMHRLSRSDEQRRFRSQTLIS